jgi:hypothetical protein
MVSVEESNLRLPNIDLGKKDFQLALMLVIEFCRVSVLILLVI